MVPGQEADIHTAVLVVESVGNHRTDAAAEESVGHNRRCKAAAGREELVVGNRRTVAGEGIAVVEDSPEAHRNPAVAELHILRRDEVGLPDSSVLDNKTFSSSRYAEVSTADVSRRSRLYVCLGGGGGSRYRVFRPSMALVWETKWCKTESWLFLSAGLVVEKFGEEFRQGGVNVVDRAEMTGWGRCLNGPTRRRRRDEGGRQSSLDGRTTLGV